MKLTTKISRQTRFIKCFILEGRDLTNSIAFRGNEWICEMENFKCDPRDGENDIDIFILAAGFPKAPCKISIVLDKKEPKEFSDPVFDKNGWLIFQKSIKLEDFKDED